MPIFVAKSIRHSLGSNPIMVCSLSIKMNCIKNNAQKTYELGKDFIMKSIKLLIFFTAFIVQFSWQNVFAEESKSYAEVSTTPTTSESTSSASTASNGNVNQPVSVNSINMTGGRTVFPAGSTIIPLAPQNIFNDPGTGSNITGIPLIWYYMDTFGMSNCEGQSEPLVEHSEYVSISFQPDCAVATKAMDANLANSRPIVSYVSDLQKNAYYAPLGVIMIQASWDKSDSVNLFTIMKSASHFISKNIKGYDKILLVGDILQRNISSQRAIEGMSQGITVTPSISSTLGRDGLSGSMFGYGRSNGESHPVSRTGATLLVVAVAPGPWAGRKPTFTQTAYITNATALPQTIQKVATEMTGGEVKPVEGTKNSNVTGSKFTVEEAVVASGR